MSRSLELRCNLGKCSDLSSPEKYSVALIIHRMGLTEVNWLRKPESDVIVFPNDESCFN
jgi:hypothetical protein